MEKYKVVLKEVVWDEFVVEASCPAEAEQKVLDMGDLSGVDTFERWVEYGGKASEIDEIYDRVIK